MSTQNVQTVIGRAVMEPEFRALLFRDPAQALASYELTEAEAASLAGVAPRQLNGAATETESRLSKSERMGINGQRDAATASGA